MDDHNHFVSSIRVRLSASDDHYGWRLNWQFFAMEMKDY
jgi:hypothetical protein